MTAELQKDEPRRGALAQGDKGMPGGAGRRIGLALVALLDAASLFAPGAARADNGRITIIEDNDGLLPDGWDRHYTQGASLIYLSPTFTGPGLQDNLYSALNAHLPLFAPGPDAVRKFDVIFGQSIFTPVKYHDPVPDPKDRPFAGWLYGGGGLLQESGGRMLENFEVLAGVVGPAALAKETQETFHSATGFNNANLDQAWSHQLKNEPGVMISYDRHWKVWRGAAFGFESDVIPDAGVTVGNVMTYAQAGFQVRAGHNLAADYGIARVRPALSGTPWFNATRMSDPFGWYIFGGVQARAVAHNIFLDGNSFTNSPSVNKNIFVADFSTGASLFWSDWVKIDFSFTERSKEFHTQKQWDHFGNVNLSFRF